MSTTPARVPYPVARLDDGQERAILFEASKCIGCRQCVEACKDWNELPRGDPYRISGANWLTIEPPVVEGMAKRWGRNSCMHCSYPICAAVCPVEAITKYREGPVVIDRNACIGCEYCIHACPWGVIGTDQLSGKASKCTMCSDRLGENADPFCVVACPVGALEFGLAAQMKARAAEKGSGATIYGTREAGGTQVFHVLEGAPLAHGVPEVPEARFPRHRIPFAVMVKVLFSLAGGVDGKWRAIKNAFAKPWRLKYRYWQRPGRSGDLS